jgi:chromosome segregation ATPase
MCVETEFKDRDGKTLESTFETKITELRAENVKLLAKITQIEEDLELSQENLQITSSERDDMQRTVEELKGKVTELEEQMKVDKEEIERRMIEVETEKSELLQKMKTVEESEASGQRFVYYYYF